MSMIRPRVEQIAALLLVGLALSGAGCGGDSPPIYEGTTGQTVALTVAGDVPMANVSIALPNGSSAGLLILDTGSPLSLLSEHALSNVGRGFSQLDVNLFELTFAKWQLAVMPLFSPSDCDETVPNGVIGADLLGHFAFHVDYRASKGTLFEPGIGGISGAEQLPVEVLGGGTVRLQGIEQTTRVGATRALIPVEVAGKTVTALIDTGASYVIAKRSLFAEAGACCLAVSTVTGTQSASLVKLASLTIGKTTLQNIAALKMPDDALFEQLSAEVGRPVDLILGGNALARFEMLLDAPNRTLQLSRYDTTPHLDEKKWLLAGFTVCLQRGVTGVALVSDVFEGSEAYKAGVRPGQQIVGVDNQAISGTLEDVLTNLRAPGVGNTVNVNFRGLGSLDLPLRNWLDGPP
jgi:predicted aspartyl protease